jgi:hypothetical protein
MGGSGAGSGGSFTPEAAPACDELASVPDAPTSALAADAEVDVAAVVALPAVAALAGFAAFVAEAPVAAVATGALAPGALAAAGMLVAIGADEKLLGGNGGRDGTPVDEVLDAGAARGGICDSRTMLTLVCFVAAA